MFVNYILMFLAFLVTVLLVVGMGSLILNRRKQVDDRLKDIRKMSFDSNPENVLRLPFTQRILLPWLSSLGHTVGRVAPNEIRTRVDKRIMYAGSPWKLNFFSLFASQVFLGLVFVLPMAFLLRITYVDAGRSFLILTLLALVGFALPYVIISSKAETRQQRIKRSLPDVLDLLLVSVEAGLGFDMAMKKVSNQMPGPLSEEIKQALDEIRMGGDRETALRGIARRTGVKEMSSFISSVIQAEQLGSNIANTLRAQADYMRQRRRQWAEEMAMKAPVKLIFPLLFFIFPALFVVILGPAVINIFRFFASL